MRRVLVSVGGGEKFSLDTPRAILARQAAKFILDAEKTIVDSFCDKLATQIQTLVQAVKSSNYKSFGTTQERLWKKFAVVRDSNLKAVWDELWLNLDDSTFHKDPLLMQHCNTKVFEQIVKSNFSLPEAACNNSSQLTDDEENGLRYAAGFVIRSVRKKIAKAHHPYKSGMLAVLALLKEESDDSTGGGDYLSYTKTWIEKVNRGGLFLISDDTHLLFQAMEYATRSCLSLKPTIPHLNLDKEKAIKTILEDPDVEFHWSHLTGSHEERVCTELIQRIIGQWLTIRGFSSAAAFMEDYKHAQHVTLKAKKALRKELKQQSQLDKDSLC